MITNSCLYLGKVFHRRIKPKEHVLKYSVFTLFADLDELDEISTNVWLFSRNAFNLFSFYDKDFGLSNDQTLFDYITTQLQTAGIHTVPTRIQLSCYPRVLGYVFNPLSLFYCIDENGQCYAIVHEVHNTFGERHAYVMSVSQSDSNSSEWIHQQADKSLFVSPFAHMGMTYEFRLNLPHDRQVVIIKAFDKEGLVITASYTGKRVDISAKRLLMLFFTRPLQSFKVIIGIHWEALRLFIKGVPWFRHQPKNTF